MLNRTCIYCGRVYGQIGGGKDIGVTGGVCEDCMSIWREMKRLLKLWKHRKGLYAEGGDKIAV